MRANEWEESFMITTVFEEPIQPGPMHKLLEKFLPNSPLTIFALFGRKIINYNHINPKCEQL